ncbi:MAG: polysaccharide biosynthesis tyrosine autokinase [Planctomycetes bacterium]|nr:polysaccharide biosynthesis tyrosine autokinase [Planctomycetota bacterium]MBI3845855.1 polysaccharide biosynthesis tyrosine autokinase [Planctomycetota bacterium]
MESHELHLADAFRILMRRSWVVLLFFAVVVSVVAIGTFRATPVYRSTARLVIERPRETYLPIQEASSAVSYFDAEKFYNTQYGLLTSRRVLKKLADLYDFKTWPEFQGLDDDEILTKLERTIDVEPEKESFLVDVSFSGYDPKRTTDVVNSLVAIYLDVTSEVTEGAVASGEKLIAEKLPELQASLDRSLKDLQDFQENNNVISYEESKTINLDEIKRLRGSVQELEAKLDELKSKKATLEQARTDGKSLEVQFLIIDNAPVRETVEKIKEEKRALDREYSNLLARGSYKKADVEALENQVHAKEDLIRSHIELALLTFDNTYAQTERLVAERSARWEKLNAESQELYKKLTEYERMRNLYNHNKDLFDKVYQRYNELLVLKSKNTQPNNVRIEYSAEVPQRPERPKKALNLALAVLVGLLGGVGLAFFFEYIDDTIKSREDVDRYLRLPPLGFVPSMGNARKGPSGTRDLVTQTDPKSIASEAYRGIRTGLAFGTPGEGKKTILVTSSSPREGKTTTAINIAVTMAQSGQKTLLIDSDLRRPRIHKTFGLDNAVGLTSLFIGDSPLEQVIRPTDVENLFVLSSGPIPPNPSEILGSDMMRDVLASCRGAFDKIVLDSPPIIAVTDACILARMADATLLVVSAHNTRKKIAAQGLDLLRNLGVNITGVVVNNMKTGKRGYYYSNYYYQYEYGDVEHANA